MPPIRETIACHRAIGFGKNTAHIRGASQLGMTQYVNWFTLKTPALISTICHRTPVQLNHILNRNNLRP